MNENIWSFVRHHFRIHPSKKSPCPCWVQPQTTLWNVRGIIDDIDDQRRSETMDDDHDERRQWSLTIHNDRRHWRMTTIDDNNDDQNDDYDHWQHSRSMKIIDDTYDTDERQRTKTVVDDHWQHWRLMTLTIKVNGKMTLNVRVIVDQSQWINDTECQNNRRSKSMDKRQWMSE